MTIVVLGSGLYLWLALASAVGLLSGLLGDGIWDGLSWLALGAPVAVILWRLWLAAARPAQEDADAAKRSR